MGTFLLIGTIPSFKLFFTDQIKKRFDDFQKMQNPEDFRDSSHDDSTPEYFYSDDADCTEMTPINPATKERAQQREDSDLIVELKFKDCMIRELHESNHLLRMKHAEAVDKIAQLRVKSDVHCECCSHGLGAGDDETISKCDQRSSIAASTYGKRSQNTKFSYLPKMPEPTLDPLAKVKVWQEINESSTDLSHKSIDTPTYGDFIHKPATWRSIASSSPRTDVFPPRLNSPPDFETAGDNVGAPKPLSRARTRNKTDFRSKDFNSSFEPAVCLASCEGRHFPPNFEPTNCAKSTGFQFSKAKSNYATENRCRSAGQRGSDASLSTVYYSNSSDLEQCHSSPEHHPFYKARLEFSAYEDRRAGKDRTSPGIVGAILNHFKNQSP